LDFLKIHVILHSYLRDKLPPNAKGRADLEFPQGAVVADVFSRLDLPTHVAWSFNGKLERNTGLALHDGDEIRIFRQGAGG
jgi:hypothetical protein